MTGLAKVRALLQDPLPGHVFEISEGGIAAAKLTDGAPEMSFCALPPGALDISPVRENVVNAEALSAAVNTLNGAPNGKKRRAALILPDYCSRVAVIDFDTLPPGAEEQHALVRFRMKKSVPFDIDAAKLSFYAQPAGGDGKVDVVVAVTPIETVARYEAPFAAAGFHPGLVTTSSLAALSLLSPDGIAVLAKLSGNALTVAVLAGSALKLVRCVELERIDSDDVEAVLLPTLAFVEDELGTPARRVTLCGFGLAGERWQAAWSQSWGLPVEPLRSRFGTPGGQNAGLLGLVESLAA